jgi:hypothetical protein
VKASEQAVRLRWRQRKERMPMRQWQSSQLPWFHTRHWMMDVFENGDPKMAILIGK